MQKRLTRSEVPVDLTWNLADIFASRQAWEDELAAIERDIPNVAKYKGRLGEGPGVLLECLEAQEAVHERFNRVGTYASLRASEDGSNPTNQADFGRAFSLGATLDAAFSFIKSEIWALPEGTLDRYRQAEPSLSNFAVYLDEILERRPYALSPETEKAVAALGEVLGAPFMIYERAKSSDMTFTPIADAAGNQVAMSFARYEDHFEQSPDHAMRRKAWSSFVEGLKRYQNTLGATFGTEVKKHVVMARLRGYPTTTHMMLQPHQATVEAYENLLNVIQSELAPHMQRYARLKKRVLGLDKLLFCDLKAPLDPAYSPQTTYEEASQLITESLERMGPEYLRNIKTAVSERWVDLADNVGKSTGAFCATPYGVHPYILITWTDTMRSAFILTHELGHAAHFALSHRNQRFSNTEPSTFFVEAPSTINELLLGQHILDKSTDARMRRWVIMQFLGTYHHNFITHLLEAELQRRIYTMAEQGHPVTAAILTTVKGEILSRFWGDTVEIDDGARLTWMRQPHYYMGLYPYTYSAGLTAATAVAQQMREEGQPAVDRWLEVLKAGGTMKPLELMRKAGVDLSSPEPIRKAVAFVGSLVDELENSFA